MFACRRGKIVEWRAGGRRRAAQGRILRAHTGGARCSGFRFLVPGSWVFPFAVRFLPKKQKGPESWAPAS